jgi:hypothetical protein
MLSMGSEFIAKLATASPEDSTYGLRGYHIKGEGMPHCEEVLEKK